MSNRLYDILNTFNNLVSGDQPKQTITESAKPKTKLEETMAKVEEKYMGFKAVEKAAKKGGAKDPAAVAASIGREKYGKKAFQKAAAAGKKMGEGVAEGELNEINLGGKEHEWRRIPIEHYVEFRKKYPGAVVRFRGPRKGTAHTRQEDATHFYVVSLAEGENWDDEYVNTGSPFPDREDDDLDTYSGEHDVDESAAPGQEDWIKSNKANFIKQYGKKKGMEVLYATAWKRSKNEGAYDAETSKEDPVFEREESGGEYGWDVPEKKTKSASSRKVAGKAYGGAAQSDDDEEETNSKPAGEKRGRGRPKGSGKKMGAKGPSGKSKLMKKATIKEAADSLGEIAEDLQHVVDRLSEIGEVELAKQLQPIVWDLDDRDPENMTEGDHGWDYPEAKTSSTRKVAGTRYGGAAQKDDDEETTAATPEKRGRGRPKGTGKKMGAQGPTGKSKLMKESRPSLMDRLLAETYASFNEDSDLTIDQDQLRQHIGDANFEQLRRAIQVTGTYPEEMYDTLYDYFSETGEMPYGAATAEDEDPYNWIHQKLDQMFGDEVGYDQENIDIDMGEPGEDEFNAESVTESKNMIAESLSRILHSYPYEVKTFLAGGDMDKDLYSALFDYYNDQGELPYQVKSGNDTVEWIADKFGTDLRNVELEEDGPKMSDVPAYLRKSQGQNFPLSRDQVTPAEQHLWVVPGPGSRDFEARAFPNTPQGKMAADEFAYGVKGKVVLSAEQPVAEETDSLGAELNELARLAGLKESIGECGEMSPFTQAGAQEPQSGMSINTNIDTRTGTKTMTITADGEVADKLAELLSLSGLASQVSSRSSEVVGQDVEQEPEMQVVAVGEAKEEDREKFHASTTPDPKVAGVDAIIDQGDDLNRKKKQHADKPKLGDNPMATENISLSKSLIRELESIKIKK